MQRFCLVALAAAVACSNGRADRNFTSSSKQLISDAAHGSQSPNFWFLPPMVPQPTLAGAFDAAESPTVQITDLQTGGTIATFTTTTGPGSETVRVDSTSQLYIVNWHTDQFPSLDATHDYRIRVTIGGRQMGFADVDVVLNQGQAKNVNTSQYIALVDGKTLPIKFFINLCAPVVCSASDQCHDAGACDPSSGVCSNPVKADGASCDDGNGCTSGDACHAGVCGGDACGAGLRCDGSGATAACVPDRQMQFLSFPPRSALVGQPLRYQTVVSIAGGTTFTVAGSDAAIDDSGVFTWTPRQGGDQSFTITATNGVSAQQTFTVNVAAPQPASAGAYSATDPSGSTVSVDAPLSPIKGAALVVPQGALPDDADGLQLSISSIPGLTPPPVPVGAPTSTPIEFGPSGATFSQPVRLALPASPAMLAAGAKVMTLDAASGQWVPVDVESVDAENGVVIAKTTHFSPYIVVPDVPVLSLDVNSVGSATACSGLPAVHAQLAQSFSQIPASAVNGWTGGGSNLTDVLAALPAGKSLQILTRIDTEVTNTTTGRQTYIVASATQTGAGLALKVVDNRQTSQFLTIPATLFQPGDPAIEAWLNGARVQNLIDSVYADLATGLGTGVSVTANVAFSVVDASLAATPLANPGIVYGGAQIAKTTAQLLATPTALDKDCDDAIDAWDPDNGTGLPAPPLTATPASYIHTTVGSPVTLQLFSTDPATTYSYVASDPALNLTAAGAVGTITPSTQGWYSVTGYASLNGQKSAWTWQVQADTPTVVYPPPTAALSASTLTTSVGQLVTMSASGTATRVAASQLQYTWTASPDPYALTATTGSSVGLIPQTDGDWVVTVTASDGVLSANASVTISVAAAGVTRPPAPPLVSPLSLNVQHATGTAAQVSIAASGTAFDAAGNPVTIGVAAAPGTLAAFSATPTAGGFVFSTSTDGAYSLLVTATDAHGNVSPPTKVSLLVTGYIDPNEVDADGDGYPASIDCDDHDPLTHPNQAPECGDGSKDLNCDGRITDVNTCDADRDGYSIAQGDANDHNASINPGAAELCDGIDNNGNGAIDEGYPGLGQPCSAGIGACKRTGVYVCGADHRSVTCNAIAGTPTKEVANGIDDDCDGVIDNNTGGGKSCPAKPNMTVTQKNGGCVYTCNAGFGDANHDLTDGCECTVTNGGVEICDGLDNNCDGRVDENLTRTTYDGPAGTLGVGVCHAGSESCSNGTWVTLQTEQTPRPEACNGADDNCNGAIDDGFNLTSDVNNCGACGVSCASTQHCISSACVANRAPTLPPLGALTLAEGATQHIAINASDADNDVLTFTLPGAPSFATLQPTGSQTAELVLAPDAASRSLANPISLEVDADDGHGGTAQAFLSLTVTHPPVITIQNFFGNQSGPGFQVRAGAWQQLLVQAGNAEQSQIALTVTSDGPGPVIQNAVRDPSQYPAWSGGGPLWYPLGGSQIAVSWQPSRADEGTVRTLHVTATGDGFTVTQDFTLSVVRGLVADAQILPGGYPSQSSPAVYDFLAGDGTAHRYLYVAEYAGVGVYDVTGDVSGTRIGFYEVRDQAYAVAVLGHYAFVADAWYGVEVLDLTNPAQPTLAAEITDPLAIPLFTDITVDAAHERIAIAAQYPDSTYVLNLHDFLATGDRTKLSFSEVIQTPAGPGDVFGDYVGRPAFVQLGSPARDCLLVPEQSAMALYVVDLASGATIGAYSEQHNDNGFGAYSVEPYTSAALPGRQLALLNTGNGLWLEVVDVTDPTAMSLVGAVNTNANMTGAALSGDRWYAGNAWFIDLVGVDLTDPANPVLIWNDYAADGYQGGVAISSDGARIYDVVGERGVDIWRSSDITLNAPNPPQPYAQHARGELRTTVAVDGPIGIAAQRDLVYKLDTSSFPPHMSGAPAQIQFPQSYQVVQTVDLRGTMGLSDEPNFDGNAGRWISNTIRVWDLSGSGIAQVGNVTTAIDDANKDEYPNRIRFIAGRQCAAVTMGQAGIALIDLQNPAAPLVSAVLKPFYNGATLLNARANDSASDGRFLFGTYQNLPAPQGTGLFVWDLGDPATSPGCGTPVALGRGLANQVFGSTIDSVVDAANRVVYTLSPFGNGVHAFSYAALQGADAGGDASTQLTWIQRILAGQFTNGVGYLLLSPSTLIVGTDNGPHLFARNPDGSLTLTDVILAATPGTYLGLTYGGYLWWDASDPGTFVEQNALVARKWAQ